MDRLILLRHGEAERDAPSGDDFDRRLARRGIAASAAMGETLADLGFCPDVVLVSAAARTRDSWEAVSKAFPKAQVRFEDSLYLAEPERVRALVKAAGAACATVMVVGHNPGLQDLTVQMLRAGGAPPALIAKAQNGFPTAAAAVFLFDHAGRPSYDGLFFPGR
ncbi:histidine phosphatase family protein [Phenylobacterium sp.]|uniref:SixA phosphatase family protein n=1 Tax=Phenylobacterium sp. TaxID=1871053 RepID=UPI0030F3AFAE